MAQDTPSRKLDQYIVRFPDGMRDKLKAAAAENGRSLNAEIVLRLEASLEMKVGEAAEHHLMERFEMVADAVEQLLGKKILERDAEGRPVRVMDVGEDGGS